MWEGDCVVLPTYYKEGVPRTLIEASAMGKPLIATNVTGCKEIVFDGENGFLCAPKSPESLAEKMHDYIRLSVEQRALMGARSREIAERVFDEKFVIEKYLSNLCLPAK